LTFEFVALDYTNPEKNQYAYMMEGFDETWIDAGARRFVSYTNLDPGKYVFKVKGSNNDGVWNEDGVSVKIAIAPPPWKTWWAYTLYVLLDKCQDIVDKISATTSWTSLMFFEFVVGHEYLRLNSRRISCLKKNQTRTAFGGSTFSRG
jgi:hypothetical protein